MLHSIPTVECQTQHCIPDEEAAVTKIQASSASFHFHGCENSSFIGWFSRHARVNIPPEDYVMLYVVEGS
jgi:hypothetical protein